MQKLTGIIAAPFTAFDASGELNLDSIDSQIASLINNKVSGALVGGTTGECGSLTLEERLTLTKIWCEKTAHLTNFPIIAHVGHSCIKDSQKLAEQAQAAGAVAVAALPPYYFKPSSAQIIVEVCREIAAAAPKLPFYYYHIPSITNVNVPVIEILKSLDDSIPNFAGIKFTYEDMYDFGLCLEYENRRFDVLCGRDESLLAGLALGAVGAVGSTYNYMAPVYLKLIAAFERGDLAAAQVAQQKSRYVIDLMIRFGGMSAAKMIMQMIGIDCGQVRLPLGYISKQKYDDLKIELESVGFFNFCSRSVYTETV
jgi:N-acetylneuraminate lyase